MVCPVCPLLLLQLHPSEDPNQHKTDFVLEAGSNMMRLLQGAYSCITLVKGVRHSYCCCSWVLLLAHVLACICQHWSCAPTITALRCLLQSRMPCWALRGVQPSKLLLANKVLTASTQ